MSYRGQVNQTTRVVSNTPENHIGKEYKHTVIDSPCHNPLRGHVYKNYDIHSNRVHYTQIQNPTKTTHNISVQSNTNAENYNNHYINNTPKGKNNEFSLRTTNNYSNTKEKLNTTRENVSNYDTNITVTRNVGQSPNYEGSKVEANPSKVNPFKNPLKEPTENVINVRERQQYFLNSNNTHTTNANSNNSQLHTYTVTNPTNSFRNNQGSPTRIKYRDITPNSNSANSPNILNTKVMDKSEIRFIEKPAEKVIYKEKPVEKVIYKEKIVEKLIKDEKLEKELKDLKLENTDLNNLIEKVQEELKAEKEKCEILHENNEQFIELNKLLNLDNDNMKLQIASAQMQIQKKETMMNKLQVDYSPNPLTKKFLNTELLKHENCFNFLVTSTNDNNLKKKIDAEANIEIAKQLIFGQTQLMILNENLKVDNEKFRGIQDIIDFNELSEEISRQAEKIVSLEKLMDDGNEYIEILISGSTKLMLEIEFLKQNQTIDNSVKTDSDFGKLKQEYDIL